MNHSITMAFRTGPSLLWPLVILLFCSTFVTSSLLQDWPRTFWLDQSCIDKTRPSNGLPSPFTLAVAQESLYMPFRGSRRLVNRLDIYVPWLLRFLFKIRQLFIDLVSDSTPWLVIRKKLPALLLLDAKRSESPPRSFGLDFLDEKYSR